MEMMCYNLVNTMACGLVLADLVENWCCTLDYIESIAMYSDNKYIEVGIACPSIYRADVERKLAPFV